MKGQKKKPRRRRTREWEHEPDRAFTHELKRHRRTTGEIKTISAERSAVPEDFEPNATVISHTKKYAFVQWDGEEVRCRIDEALAEQERGTLLAPGDAVLVEMIEDQPTVRAVAARHSKLSRPGIEGGRIREQVIAANVDALVIVVAAAKPRFKAGVVDRYLIIAQLGGVEPIVCFNKCDLSEEEPPELDAYRDLGLTVIKTSAVEGGGVDELRDALKGKLAVFAGQSGVGKSSLLSALQPELEIDTQAVSAATEKGKHTTTASRLYELPDGLRIIDTPGIRQLGLRAISEQELPLYFPEFDEAAAGCKFRNCTHTHEPECAVLAGVESGEIPERRYKSYLRIRESLD